jgi:hypothetical protein
MVITIRKIEDAARKLPNENISVHQAAAANEKAAPATPAAPAAPRPPRPPTVPKDRPAPPLHMDCPLCSKPCLDMLGILRHYAKAHIGVVKPNQQELEALKEKQIERNRKEKNGGAGAEDATSVTATPSATPTPAPASASSHKRKRAVSSEENTAASTAIKTLAVVATIGDPDESGSTPTPRSGKRSRATPSRSPTPTPSPPPTSISALAAAADSCTEEDVEMREATAASPTVPLSGGSANSRSRLSNASPASAPIKPFKLSLKGAAQPKPANGAALPQVNANNVNKRKRDESTAETDEIAPPTSKQRRSTPSASPNEASSSAAAAAPSTSPTPSAASGSTKKKPRNELEMLLNEF